MAAGLPVVAYRVGGNAELVNESAETLVVRLGTKGFPHAVKRIALLERSIRASNWAGCPQVRGGEFRPRKRARSLLKTATGLCCEKKGVKNLTRET